MMSGYLSRLAARSGISTVQSGHGENHVLATATHGGVTGPEGDIQNGIETSEEIVVAPMPVSSMSSVAATKSPDEASAVSPVDERTELVPDGGGKLRIDKGLHKSMSNVSADDSVVAENTTESAQFRATSAPSHAHSLMTQTEFEAPVNPEDSSVSAGHNDIATTMSRRTSVLRSVTETNAAHSDAINSSDEPYGDEMRSPQSVVPEVNEISHMIGVGAMDSVSHKEVEQRFHSKDVNIPGFPASLPGQPELKVAEKTMISPRALPLPQQRSHKPDMQVSIGNIQVDVHQSASQPVEVHRPLPVPQKGSQPRPVRLSRHYLRDW